MTASSFLLYFMKPLLWDGARRRPGTFLAPELLRPMETQKISPLPLPRFRFSLQLIIHVPALLKRRPERGTFQVETYAGTLCRAARLPRREKEASSLCLRGPVRFPSGSLPPGGAAGPPAEGGGGAGAAAERAAALRGGRRHQPPPPAAPHRLRQHPACRSPAR